MGESEGCHGCLPEKNVHHILNMKAELTGGGLFNGVAKTGRENGNRGNVSFLY